jgi:hypothetical protein
MPQDQLVLPDFPASTGLEDVVVPTSEPISPANDQLDRPVNIPLEDVTARVDEVNQVQQMTAEVQAKVAAVLRSPNRLSSNETTQEYNERVKREFTAQVMEARRQAAAPPPPPQPVAPAMVERTRKEMEAGRKQSAYWAEQQKNRPLPNARDVAAAGTTVPVFQPASYVHEKGEGFEGKQHTRSDASVR